MNLDNSVATAPLSPIATALPLFIIITNALTLVPDQTTAGVASDDAGDFIGAN